MKLIVCTDKNYGIGYDNKLLVNNPIDMKFFKEKTKGHIVVMGRKTFESFPNQKPLPNRINIVITKDKKFKKDGIIVFNNIYAFLNSIYNTKNTYVIGGASIYKQLFKYCDELFITKMENKFQCDTFLDTFYLYKYKIVSQSELMSYKDLNFKFIHYKKR